MKKLPGEVGNYPNGILCAKDDLKISLTDKVYIEQTGAEKYETFIYNGNETGLTVYHGIYNNYEAAEKHYNELKGYF